MVQLLPLHPRTQSSLASGCPGKEAVKQVWYSVVVSLSGCRGITCALGQHTAERQRKCMKQSRSCGGAENTSTGKRKYEMAHFARMENACTENASTMQTFSQIKKSLVLYKLVWCIFEWGVQVDYRLFFLR